MLGNYHENMNVSFNYKRDGGAGACNSAVGRGEVGLASIFLTTQASPSIVMKMEKVASPGSSVIPGTRWEDIHAQAQRDKDLPRSKNENNK